jgi:hypothetical protein
LVKSPIFCGAYVKKNTWFVGKTTICFCKPKMLKAHPPQPKINRQHHVRLDSCQQNENGFIQEGGLAINWMLIISVL